jgi:hypothetical protein
LFAVWEKNGVTKWEIAGVIVSDAQKSAAMLSQQDVAGRDFVWIIVVDYHCNFFNSGSVVNL